MIIRKLAQKILFLSILLIQAPYVKTNTPNLLIYSMQYPQQQLLINSSNDPFDLDRVQVRGVVQEKPLSKWQLFLMSVGCSVVVTASNIYDYIAVKLAAIHTYIASKLSSTTSTCTIDCSNNNE
jgi:hypothetical protein